MQNKSQEDELGSKVIRNLKLFGNDPKAFFEFQTTGDG